MKKIFILIIFIFISNIIYTQNIFNLLLSNTEDLEINDLIETDNQKYILIGNKRDLIFNYTYSEGIIYKINNVGKIEKEIVLSKKDSIYSIRSIIKHNNTDFVVIGSSGKKEIPESYDNIVFSVYNADLELYFEKSYKLSFDSISHIKTHQIDENYITFLSYYTFEKSNKVFNYVVKFNSNGDTIFTKHLPLAQYQNFGVTWDFIKINSNKYLLFASGFSNHSFIEIVETDSMFNIINVSTVLENIHQPINSEMFTDTTFIVHGTRANDKNRFQNNQFVCTIFDTNLNIIKQAEYGAEDTTDLPAIRKNISFSQNENIYIGGTHHFDFYELSYIKNWYTLLSIDIDLNLNWQKFYGGDACYRLYCVLATEDGGCLMVGTRYDANVQNSERDVYIIKTDSIGHTTHINGELINTTEIQIFPNPFSDNITLELFDNQKKADFYLYNSLGQIVLQNKIVEQSTFFDLSFLQSGIYMYKLVFENDKIEKGKIIKY